MRTGAERACRDCGKSFEVTREWQVFCSTLCRKRWNKRFHEICFYCGATGTHRDHILPHSQRTVGFIRYFGNVEYVYACQECNSTLQNYCFPSIVSRVKFLADAYLSKYKLDEGAVEWSDEEISELGPALKRRIRKLLAVRRKAEDRYVYLRALAQEMDEV